MEIISGKLYRLKVNPSSNRIYKYNLNPYNIWAASLQFNRLIPIDLSKIMNVLIICVAKITNTFGIFLIGNETVGVGIENLEEHEQS